MTARVGSLAFLLAVFLAFVPAGAIAAGGGISPSCNPGNCSGWYKVPVTVQFVITPLPGNSVTPGAECGPYTQSSDTTGVTRNCVVVFTDSVGSTTSRASASCTDNAGNVGGAGVPVNYDSGAPSIDSITFDRPPDSNGWYNHPVRVTFHGSDGGSGIAACTDVTYPGPDTNSTTVNGTCTDKAGNRAGGTSPAFKYDATPPTISNVGFDWDDGTATLTWTASPDTKAIEIDRTPGTPGPDPSAVFKGLASTFEDTGLTNKVKYVYTISGYDEAGNKASESVSIVPGAKLYSPARGSIVTSLPLLAWRPVTGASYYNLQVFYGVGKALRRVTSLTVSGRKVMSVWPNQPRYRMQKSWKYKGKVRKLALGHYRWYVYPGLGKRTAHKYGPLIGQSDFFVAKR